ncbi:MAG: cellulase family glycosylhydrolase, partial [Candidatus Promineifilaceae bacterium]
MIVIGGCAAPAATTTPRPPSATPGAPDTTWVRPTTAPPAPEATAVPPTAIAVSPTAAPADSSELAHRIGVRVSNGTGEFYDRLTGERFIPRGFNYVRLAPMSAADPNLWHSTLNPGLYEPERAAAALQAMGAAGYNVVRVFVDCCRAGNNAGDPRGGVSQAYLANVIDFLDKAKTNGITVLLVLDLTPAQGGYDEMWGYCCTVFDGENLRYLTPGGHAGERRFDRDFIQALMANNAPLEAIFAFDLTNEVHFNVDKPPFSLSSGKVTTANHKTYDMASADDKQRMMDENLVYWIDQMRASILEVDPTALVTVSFPAINSGNTTVNPQPAILESTADFVDLHAYMGWGLSFEEYMRRFGVDGPTEKPLILGEFGAERRAYRSAATAARALTEWQAESCQYGFDGWLLWTWDGEEQETLWHAMSENGEIGGALSPVERPDPCQP